MAYIIVTANGEELERRALNGQALVIGRAADVDLPVRDVLMSRRHCRLEPTGTAWRIVDLESKNGTYIGWEKLSTRLLVDGDALRIGRTVVTYRAGPYEPPPPGTVHKQKLVRPADPFEALTGTVMGYVFVESQGQEQAAAARVPSADSAASGSSAQPPTSPAIASAGRRVRETVATVAVAPSSRGSAAVAELTSSSWESSVSERQAERSIPRPVPKIVSRNIMLPGDRPRAPLPPLPAAEPAPSWNPAGGLIAVVSRTTDLSLQATPQLLDPPQPGASDGWAAVRETDWGMVLLLLAGCVMTVLLVMSMWLLAVAPPN